MKKVVERNLLMNKVVKGNDSTIWAECTTFVRKYNGSSYYTYIYIYIYI